MASSGEKRKSRYGFALFCFVQKQHKTKKRFAIKAHLAEMKLAVNSTARARNSPVNGLFILLMS